MLLIRPFEFYGFYWFDDTLLSEETEFVGGYYKFLYVFLKLVTFVV